MIAIVVRCGQQPERVELPDDHDAAFKRVQELVGGYVERVVLGPYDIYCDEDGIAKGLPMMRLGLRGTYVVLAHCMEELKGLDDGLAGRAMLGLLLAPDLLAREAAQ